MVIALFTALIAPFFVDWTSHRAAFEREASRILGQPVKVAGRASVRILPLPSVTFTELSIGANDDGRPMMTVESFTLLAELMPLLSGEVKIVEMQLTGPHAILRVKDNGIIDWTDRKEAIVDPDKVQIERLKVERGSFEIEGLAGGRRIAGEGFNAEISARALTGPWQIAATGEVEGVPVELTLSTGKVQETGAVRVGFEARRLDQPYRLRMDGPVKVEKSIVGWTGSFAFLPVAGKDGKRDPAALPVQLAGDFAATPDAVDISSYQLDVGSREDPYTITGQGRVEIREQVAFRIEADGRQIDLDAVARNQGSTAATTGIGERVAAVRAVIDRIPVPAASGEVDFELPAIVSGDTVIREISAKLRPDTDGWRISALRATLPGNTSVEAQGRLATGADFGFTGRLLVASRQPTGFANWLSGKSSAALRRLKTTGFEADATLTPSQASFENLELSLDGVTLTGSLKRLAPEGARPAILAELAGAEMDIDDLRALLAFTGDPDSAGWRGHDFDLSLSAGLLLGEGLEARDAGAQLRIVDGSLSIDRLEVGDFYGARIDSSGRIADLAGQPNGNFSLVVKADDGSALAALARERLGPSQWLEALAADGELVSGLDLTISVDAQPVEGGARATVSLTGVAGGTQIDASNRFEGMPVAWWDANHAVSARLSNERAEILARQLALPVLPVETPGPLNMAIDLAGRPLQDMEVSVAAGAPGTDLAAKGTLRFDRKLAGAGPDFGKPAYRGTLTLGSDDLDPWLFLFGQALPGIGEGNPVSLRSEISGSGGKHAMDALSGQVAGNGFSGNLALALPPSGEPMIEGDLVLDSLSLPVLGELLLGNGVLSAAGAGNDAGEAEFSQTPHTAVDARIGLRAANLVTGSGEDASGFVAALAIADGSLSLQQAQAEWLGGKIAGGMVLKNVGGDATFNVQATLTGADAARALASAGHRPFLAGTADASLSADAQGRSLEGLVASLAGSGTVSVSKGRMVGMRSEGLPDIIAASDAEGFEVGAATVVPLADAAFLGGETPFDELGGAFSLAAGRLSIRNLATTVDGGRVEAEAGADLRTGSGEMRVTLSPDPGEAALAGAEPSVTYVFEGMPKAIARSVDTSALEGFLALRAFEREQRRVEILQASVLERQRLRREVMASNYRAAAREAARIAEEERRRAAEEAARLKAEAEAATAEANGTAAAQPAADAATTEPPTPSQQLFQNLDKLLGN